MYKTPQMKLDESIRSQHGTSLSLVTIANRTLRNVDIIWVDTVGNLITYKKLQPEAWTAVNTFSGHPWVFCDADSGEPMHVDNRPVLWPPPAAAAATHGWQRHRILVHLPMRSLRDIVLWSILAGIGTVDQIDRLQIPATLKLDLMEMFEERQELMNQ